ncbi:hypothetical protein [Vitiosangium sp. GDMCC 1.1324]|uniref:hypothetical protein n=1 Tax=Vitiosangium sp. (strain GDMCC 1.1324) TaxID=2138576 RepID=UPI000D3B80CB|nr:hypothetical protein [Vitiosangium sp. GDMCC 1.1324]PTL77479.1 hypothetical protein DAT35_44590 [Vitiosangium sp. GDMCC 1.1324]
MWKRVGLFLAVSLLGLGSGSAEARFGKSSRPSSPSPSPGHGSPGSSAGRPYRSPYYGSPWGYYGYYGNPWVRYYYDPSWAWPYMGPGRPYYYGRYYDLMWRNRLMPRPNAQVESTPAQPIQVDLTADAGFVAQGYAVGLGLQAEGEQLGFGVKLNMLNLATDDGSAGRDRISLLGLKPSVLLVSRDNVRLRLSGGLDIAFAPDVTFVGPGVGASSELRLVGPLQLEASGNWTILPFTQLTGDAGLAVKLGPVRLRGGYRAIYLDDRGYVDGNRNRELFAGPYAGLALVL